MPIKNTYRGSEAYNAVFAKLVETAKNQTTVTYIDLSIAAKLPSKGQYMAEALSAILKEVTDECFNRSMPLLPCLVVRYDSGLPGDGFFAMLKSSFSDRCSADFSSDEEKEEFVMAETYANYNHWS